MKHLICSAVIVLFPCLMILIGMLCGNINRRGKFLIGLGLTIIVLSSSSLVSTPLLGHLENQYPPFQSTEENKKVEYVVVLGGLSNPDPKLPLSTRLGAAMLSRLIEGMRIALDIPGSKLVLSGNGKPVSEAILMKDLALQLGFNPDKIVLETESATTYEEAINLKPLLQDKSFILVTSARHMPRSMNIFKQQAMNPVPAPTNFVLFHEQKATRVKILPNYESLNETALALYEYLATMKALILRNNF